MLKLWILLFLSFWTLGASANGLSALKSWPVFIAAKTCAAATGFCDFEFQVSREMDADNSSRDTMSCHKVDKAVDILGSSACLEAIATCLSLNPIALPTFMCFNSALWLPGWAGRFVCKDIEAHTDHIHLQPVGGCKKEVKGKMNHQPKSKKGKKRKKK